MNIISLHSLVIENVIYYYKYCHMGSNIYHILVYRMKDAIKIACLKLPKVQFG
jgi:hypothetical protein